MISHVSTAQCKGWVPLVPLCTKTPSEPPPPQREATVPTWVFTTPECFSILLLKKYQSLNSN